MKFFKYLLFLVLIIIIALSVYIAVQPGSYDITRTRVIAAPKALIYDQVIDYTTWPQWTTWAEKDPNAKIEFGEQSKGVGGSYSWVDKDGRGNMKTLEATPHVLIEQALQFEDYDPATVYWKFETVDSGTQVTWGMKAEKMPFIFKGYATLYGGMDKMIGPDFESGLVRLDSLTVASMEKYNITVNGITEYGGGFYVYTSASTKIKDLSTKIEELMPKVGRYVAENNISTAGMPFTLYHSWDERNGTTLFSCAVPTTARVITESNDILSGQLEPFKALKVTLTGDYSNLEEAWEKAYLYIEENKLERAENAPMLEYYTTDPGDEPNPANWITELYIAL